jgi:hypothetical protein
MAPGVKAELARVRRENARTLRHAALERRQKREALGNVQLGPGVGINDLSILQANEMAFNRQGLQAQARAMQAQIDEAARGTTESTRERAIQAQRLETELQANRSVATSAHTEAIRSNDLLLKALGTSRPSLATSGPATPLPVTPPPVGTTTRTRAAKVLPRTPPALPPTPTAKVAKKKKQKGKGFGDDGVKGPLRRAMDDSEAGRHAEAQVAISEMRRSIAQAAKYCRSCVK